MLTTTMMALPQQLSRQRENLMETPVLPKQADWISSPTAKTKSSTGNDLLALFRLLVVTTLAFLFLFTLDGLAKSHSESVPTGYADRNAPSQKARGGLAALRLKSAFSLSIICTPDPVVTNNANNGAGSLRQAILDACDGSNITFSSLFNSAQTITLTSQLLIDKNLTVTGPGADLMTISGNNAVRVLSIATGSFNVTLTNLSVANGSSTAGGGILNDSTGTLSIINSKILFNSATNGGIGKGGGINNNSTGTVNIADSTVANNSALGIILNGTGSANGGGIANGPQGKVNITNSTLAGNSANGDPNTAPTTPGNNRLGAGGAIYNSGSMSITNSMVSGNSASSLRNDSLCFCNGFGGAIYNGGTIDLINSTLSENSVIGKGANGAEGGGLYNQTGGTVNVTTSTLSGNSVLASSPGVRAFGGGISNQGTLVVASSTVVNNSAVGSSGGASGGGVSNRFGSSNIRKSTIAGNSAGGGTGGDGGGVASNSGMVNVTNSIIATNAGAPTSAPDVSGTFTSNGYNLIGKRDGSTGFTNGSNNDQAGSGAAPINPLLGPLFNNGGTTQTLALLSASPAIDKGSAIIGITADQRGLTRTVDFPRYANALGGDGSDIGAYEVQIQHLILDVSGPGPEQAAALDSLLFLRDPFLVVNSADLFYPGTDRNTRVTVFATDLQLGSGEPSSAVVINLIDSNSQSYNIAAEDVRSVPSSGFTQVIFRLPDNLPPGVCTIIITAHGQSSNVGTFRIRV